MNPPNNKTNKNQKTKMQKKALLIIDGQNDFVLQSGALPVAGAIEDMMRVADFIKKNGTKLSNISCSLDSHRTIDIAHPSWWSTPDGKAVSPFTPISAQDLADGKFTAKFYPKWSFDYVKKLEDQGEFGHFIWPEHCLIGSTGAALYEPLHKVINGWEAQSGIGVDYVVKGDNQFTEHFGIFRANIEIPQDPRTQFNQVLVKKLSECDQVFLAGEARSHCVANSVRQLVREAPAFMSKLTILEDCMSDVGGLPQGFYDQVDVIYSDAKAAGAQFAKSTDITL